MAAPISCLELLQSLRVVFHSATILLVGDT
jgi:hypothetical protein